MGKKAGRAAHGMKKKVLRAARKAKRAAHGKKMRARRAHRKAKRAAALKKRNARKAGRGSHRRSSSKAAKKAKRAAYIKKMRAGKPITRGASQNPRYIRKYKRSSKAMRMRRHHAKLRRHAAYKQKMESRRR